MSIVHKLGIHNFGNSCYLNSTLQCLFHSDYFIEFITNINNNKIEINSEILNEFKSIIPNNSNNYTYLKYISNNSLLHVFFHFSKIIYTIQNHNYDNDSTYSIVPVNFYKVIQKNFKFNGEQQDVSELIIFFIDRILHESLQNIKTFPKQYEYYKYVKNELNSYSPILPIFYGLYKYSTKCKVCKNISSRYEPFNIINLHLKKQENNEKLSIDNLLQNLLEKEKLFGDNLFYCEKCEKKNIAFRKLSIIALPEILIFKFIRYNLFTKNEEIIDFPFQLNLDKYINKCLGINIQTNYNLYGVINHYGNMNGGHYIACCKNNVDANWYLFNDDNVSKIINSEIIVNKNAYILFYKKIKSFE
jgi:ubiquitin C-terminal hydrolase